MRISEVLYINILKMVEVQVSLDDFNRNMEELNVQWLEEHLDKLNEPFDDG